MGGLGDRDNAGFTGSNVDSLVFGYLEVGEDRLEFGQRERCRLLQRQRPATLHGFRMLGDRAIDKRRR